MSKIKESLLLSELMVEVEHLYHCYGAAVTDDMMRDRLQFIQHRIGLELHSRPELAEGLKDDKDGKRHFIMQMLLEMVTEQAREVTTPVGTIVAYPKHSCYDDEGDFPGVYIDLKRPGEDDILLACVEWVSPEDRLQCCVYANGCSDSPEPDPITYYDLEEED